MSDNAEYKRLLNKQRDAERKKQRSSGEGLSEKEKALLANWTIEPWLMHISAWKSTQKEPI